MKTLVITAAAQADLKAIARYTEREWGLDQQRRYLDAIKARLLQLLEHPTLGRSRDEIAPGYRSLLNDQHVIFYKITVDSIEIIRVLHARMDLKRHLGAGKTGPGGPPQPPGAAGRRRKIQTARRNE